MGAMGTLREITASSDDDICIGCGGGGGCGNASIGADRKRGCWVKGVSGMNGGSLQFVFLGFLTFAFGLGLSGAEFVRVKVEEDAFDVDGPATGAGTEEDRLGPFNTTPCGLLP